MLKKLADVAENAAKTAYANVHAQLAGSRDIPPVSSLPKHEPDPSPPKVLRHADLSDSIVNSIRENPLQNQYVLLEALERQDFDHALEIIHAPNMQRSHEILLSAAKENPYRDVLSIIFQYYLKPVTLSLGEMEKYLQQINEIAEWVVKNASERCFAHRYSNLNGEPVIAAMANEKLFDMVISREDLFDVNLQIIKSQLSHNNPLLFKAKNKIIEIIINNINFPENPEDMSAKDIEALQQSIKLLFDFIDFYKESFKELQQHIPSLSILPELYKASNSTGKLKLLAAGYPVNIEFEYSDGSLSSIFWLELKAKNYPVLMYMLRECKASAEAVYNRMFPLEYMCSNAENIEDVKIIEWLLVKSANKQLIADKKLLEHALTAPTHVFTALVKLWIKHQIPISTSIYLKIVTENHLDKLSAFCDYNLFIEMTDRYLSNKQKYGQFILDAILQNQFVVIEDYNNYNYNNKLNFAPIITSEMLFAFLEKADNKQVYMLFKYTQLNIKILINKFNQELDHRFNKAAERLLEVFPEYKQEKIYPDIEQSSSSSGSSYRDKEEEPSESLKRSQ